MSERASSPVLHTGGGVRQTPMIHSGLNASVLIVEDDVDIANLMVTYFEHDGIHTRHCDTGEAGLQALTEQQWDLVVLDLNLPGIDGFQVLQELRKTTQVPVVIVSAREDDADIVLGLGIGADDFVTKPFSPKVLVARIRARLRRAGEATPQGRIYRFGEYHLEPDSYLLRKGETRVTLAPREFELLVYLVRHAGVPRSPEQIYSDVWGNRYGEVATVGVHIQRLRRKIERNPSDPQFIVTVHGFGYTFAKEMFA